MPNWTTKINLVDTADAAHINDIQKHITWECPEYYGAVGDGVTDDTVAIQEAIDATQVGGAVRFGNRTYLVSGSGESCLLVDKNIHLLGTPGKSYIIGYPSSATTDVIRIEVDDNDNQGDVRQQLIYGIKCGPAGGGRNGIMLADSTLNQLYLTIDQCHLGGYDENGGKAIFAESKYAFTTISNCQLEEGIHFQQSGDGQHITNNLIFGNTYGIVFDLTYGTYSHIVFGNTIVSTEGAIYIRNGSQIKILYNQIEQTGANTGAYSCHIYIGNTSYSDPVYGSITGYDSESVDIVGNNLGGGSNLNDIIAAASCHHLLVEHNHINKSVVWDVNYLNAGCTYNRVGLNNLLGVGRSNSYDPNINDNGSNNAVFKYAEHWAGTPAQYMRGDKTWVDLAKEAVDGLGKNDNPTFAGVKLSGLTSGTIPYAVTPTEKIDDGGLEAWTSATDLTNWNEYTSGTSSVNQASGAGNIHGGTYAARLDIDASNNAAWFNTSVTLTVGELYKLSFWYKTESGKTAYLQINDSSLAQYLTSAGAWTTSLTAISLPAQTSWTQYSIEFYPHESYADYYVYFANNSAASSSIWFDDISLIEYEPLADSPITTDGTKVNIANLASYANDAAAGAAGLVAGDLYRETGTDPLRLAVKS